MTDASTTAVCILVNRANITKMTFEGKVFIVHVTASEVSTDHIYTVTHDVTLSLTAVPLPEMSGPL